MADDDEDEDVDVCGLDEVEPDTEHIDDVFSVMKTLHNDTRNRPTTMTTTRTTTSGLSDSIAEDSQSTSAVSTSLMDSDVGQALDAALQSDIDGLLSTINDDQIACTSSAAIVSSSADCLFTASVLPAELTETDQHYLFYSAQADELIDTFLRSTDAGDNDAEPAVYSELQAVQLTAEDFSVDSINDAQMGGMLVELDSSLLTIIELGNHETSVDTGACLTVTPGGYANQVVNGETTAWNVFQGLEVSQFQVIGSEPSAIEAPADNSPTPEHGTNDDATQNLAEEGSGGSGSDASEPSTGSGSNAIDDAGCPDDAAKTDSEQPSVPAADVSDDEYVLVVDCGDGEPDEVEYEIVDEANSAATSAAESPDAADQFEVGTTNDASNDVATSS